jgi:RNA polymerase-binding transcription factor DksA
MKKCDWCGKEIPFAKIKAKGKFYCSEECLKNSK